MKQAGWTYHVEEVSADSADGFDPSQIGGVIKSRLNHLGAAGWELVSTDVHRSTTGQVLEFFMIFKKAMG